MFTRGDKRIKTSYHNLIFTELPPPVIAFSLLLVAFRFMITIAGIVIMTIKPTTHKDTIATIFITCFEPVLGSVTRPAGTKLEH